MLEPAAPFPTNPCRSCQAPVIPAITQGRLRRITVDSQPTQAGNIALDARHGQLPLARVLVPAQRFGLTRLYLEHLCPNRRRSRS